MSRAQRGFTLIELLIVIGILATLATLTILVINPAELFKQARDVKRMNDAKILVAMINYAKLGGNEIGMNSKAIDISLPDAIACPTVTAPTLSVPAGWSRRCKIAGDFLKMDGTGWLEVNVGDPFSSLNPFGYLAAVNPPYDPTGSLVGRLPVDPVNAGTANFYYMYLHDVARNDDFLFVIPLESAKYLAKAASDGGYDAARYETGTNLTLWNEAVGTCTGAAFPSC